MTMLLEASEDSIDGSWDGGKIVWSVRYEFQGEDEKGSQLTAVDQLQQRMQHQLQHHHHHHAEKRKLQVRLEIQKDDIQAVLPISKVTHDTFSNVNVNFTSCYILFREELLLLLPLALSKLKVETRVGGF